MTTLLRTIEIYKVFRTTITVGNLTRKNSITFLTFKMSEVQEILRCSCPKIYFTSNRRAISDEVLRATYSSYKKSNISYFHYKSWNFSYLWRKNWIYLHRDFHTKLVEVFFLLPNSTILIIYWYHRFLNS